VGETIGFLSLRTFNFAALSSVSASRLEISGGSVLTPLQSRIAPRKKAPLYAGSDWERGYG